MKTAKVDYSQGLRGGLVRVNQRRASEPLLVGDVVKAVDPEEDLSFTGTVERLDEDGRFAYLRMDWEDTTDSAPQTRIFYTAVLELSNLYRAAVADVEPFMLGATCTEPSGGHSALREVVLGFEPHESTLLSLFAGSHEDDEDDWEDDPIDDLVHRVMLAR